MIRPRGDGGGGSDGGGQGASGGPESGVNQRSCCSDAGCPWRIGIATTRRPFNGCEPYASWCRSRFVRGRWPIITRPLARSPFTDELMPAPPSRDDLASLYLDQLEFDPYPVQEEALLAWFTPAEGVLVCAPTGTGKTMIAEAALFEALHTGKRAYYTTPLIALTEQKFREMQEAAVRWGFAADDVGLVTGNRRVNPDARILVVVAEILLNRLLHPGEFDFDDVSAVVMDEFHSFNDPERGVVWELSLALLPKHVRLLLLSATVGNAVEFLIWLQQSHGRTRAADSEHRPQGAAGVLLGRRQAAQRAARNDGGRTTKTRRTPTLLFCFNRSECWSVAEQIKGQGHAAGRAEEAAAGCGQCSTTGPAGRGRS